MNIISVLSFFKRPLVIIVIAALLIRLILMPFLTYGYDIYHWALIVSNINSGNNLYDLDGYYYTPVWGYLLGFIQMIQQFLIDAGPMGMRFTNLLGMENLQYPYHIATVTTVWFNIVMKIPLLLCDFAVGYLIYWLVKDRTGSARKAAYGLAFWLFCPIVIYMSAVQSMFDTFSALLLVLSVILFYKDKCFLGGMLFSTAVLLKFFPAFCIFVILAYVIVKHREDGLAKLKVLESVAGMAIMALVLMLPLVLNGQVGDAFSFIFGRAGDASMFATIALLFNGTIAILCATFFGYLMYRTPSEKADKKMFMYILLTVAAAVLMSSTPQYIIILLPFLILHMLAEERAYTKLWVIIGVAAFISAALHNNLSMFAALSEFTTLVSPDWLVSGMQAIETNVLGQSLIALLTMIAQVFQYIGTCLVIIFGLGEMINKKLPAIGGIVQYIKDWRTKEEVNNEA
jgi:hypothetical protein